MIILLDVDHAMRGINNAPRIWLIDLLREHHVIALSARDAQSGQEEIEALAREGDWRPTEAHFNPDGLSAPAARLYALEHAIWPEHGQDATYVAVETDSAALIQYRNIGIMAAPPAMFEGYHSINEGLQHICRLEAQSPIGELAKKTSTKEA